MTDPQAAETPAWKPIGRHERRVLGVLVEKAKTTPDNYPMTLSALVAGSNQKSNRTPLMQLNEDDVTIALDHLRAVGAAREVQGVGRVPKYRHAAYEWLGVDSPGAAVITELLLRGPQTAGELRARASRMHDFPDLATVTAVIDQLTRVGLVQALTPAGRGQTFAHGLYPADEQQHLAAKISQSEAAPPPHAAPPSNSAATAELAQRVEQLESAVEALTKRLEFLES